MDLESNIISLLDRLTPFYQMRMENDFYIIIDPVSKKCKFHTRVLMDLWKKRVI